MTAKDQITAIRAFINPKTGRKWRMKDIADEIGRDKATVSRIVSAPDYEPNRNTIKMIDGLFKMICCNNADYIL